MGFHQTLAGYNIHTFDTWSSRCCSSVGFTSFEWSVFSNHNKTDIYTIKIEKIHKSYSPNLTASTCHFPCSHIHDRAYDICWMASVFFSLVKTISLVKLKSLREREREPTLSHCIQLRNPFIFGSLMRWFIAFCHFLQTFPYHQTRLKVHVFRISNADTFTLNETFNFLTKSICYSALRNVVVIQEENSIRNIVWNRF